MHSHFDDKQVKIIDLTTGTIIAKGPLMLREGLYAIDLTNAAIERAYTMYLNANIDTWHQHLRHANYQAILQLAYDCKIKSVPSLSH